MVMPTGLSRSCFFLVRTVLYLKLLNRDLIEVDSEKIYAQTETISKMGGTRHNHAKEAFQIGSVGR